MTDILALGESDLPTVAASAFAACLDGIQVDGKVCPAILSQVFPTENADLPCICVVATNQSFSQISGKNGRRLQRIDVTFRATLVMTAPADIRAGLEIKAGKVRMEIQQRIAGNTTLRLADGTPIATDVTIRGIDNGFASGGTMTTYVSQMFFNAVIHHREGDHGSSLVSRKGA